ncbi:MAG: tectonin domain-containing protein [Pseudomonadota bacterium]
MKRQLPSQPTTSAIRLHAPINIYHVIFLLLMLAPFASHAQHAYVEGDRVYLPVVDDYPRTLSLELRILRGTFPLEFVIEKRGTAEGPVRLSSAWYDGNLLLVPEVWINDVSYWADLRVLSDNRLRLEAFAPNPVSDPSNGGVYHHEEWEYMPGAARDIGVGADGTVWAVGTGYGYGDNYGLYRWDGRNWYESRGSAIRVDVDPSGNPWIINADNEIWHLYRGRWEYVPGQASDIGIGADGSVWAVGIDDRTGGSSIYQLGNYGWTRVSGTAVKIDVDPNGSPWVINEDEQIYRRENGFWKRMPGKARDIGIGADGTVWVIGNDDRDSGYGIYRFNGTDWDRVSGSGSQISVGPDGEPWVVNRDGDIYRSWGSYY